MSSWYQTELPVFGGNQQCEDFRVLTGIYGLCRTVSKVENEELICKYRNGNWESGNWAFTTRRGSGGGKRSVLKTWTYIRSGGR